MLRKALKYDVRSIMRIFCIIALSTVAISVVGTFGFRFGAPLIMREELLPYILGVISVLFYGISKISVYVSAAFIVILIYYRFYKNFFTDEGYLTFTLPVKRKTLLLSKLINVGIFTVLQLVVSGICFAVDALFAVAPENGAFVNTEWIDEIILFFRVIFGGSGAWAVAYVVEILLLIIMSSFFSISLMFFCITFGSVIAKRAKILAAIGLYYGINLVLSVLSVFALIIFLPPIVDGISMLSEGVSANLVNLVITIVVLVVVAIVATIAFLMYFVTQGCIERRINLE